MHTFRKYISNRGSALFMVISTMTALMITCMAMYFTVVASRSTTYTIFNQKQSYQNAISIYDMLLNDAQNEKSDFRDMLLGMKVGDEKKATDTDETLGAYEVTVKRLEDQTEKGIVNQVFDIVVTTTVNGVTETIHSQTYYQPPSTKDEPITNNNVAITPTFAATGYVSNDVYLDKGTFYSDVYFDNEITHFGAYETSELFVYGDVNCAGSLVFLDTFAWNNRSNGTRPITVAVRNMLTGLGTVSNNFIDGDTFLVGGDAHLTRALQGAAVYVLGDLHLGGQNQGSTKFYVNGNVYLNGLDVNQLQLYCNGIVYKGTVDNPGEQVNCDGTWNDAAKTNSSIMSVAEMGTDLTKRTQTNPYYKWTIKDEVVDLTLTDTGAKEDYCEHCGKYTKGNHKTLKTSTQSYEPIYIVHQDAYTEDNNPYTDKDNTDATLDAKWLKGCVIDDIEVNANGYFFIIIDTGDNPENVYTIRLQANTDGLGGKKYFTWNAGKSGVRPIVLTRGRGSVVIDVPAGVIYQDVTNGLLCHQNWWVLSGRDVITNRDDGNCTAQHLDSGVMKDLVHTTCGKNCSSKSPALSNGCNTTGNITTKDSTEKCTRILANGQQCAETKKIVKCAYHDIEVTYCPECENQLVQESEGVWNFCKDHVDKHKVDLKASTCSGNLNKDTKGKLIYPNTNIYLVSSDESADFRFGRDQYGFKLSKNVMVGYVYAPYLTFAANGVDEGDFPKYIGGMTVSDYNFSSKGTFVMCLPDQNPANLMDEECLGHKITVQNDWKIDLITH